MTMTRVSLGICLGVLLFVGTGLGAEQDEVGKFVKARIEIGEMMTSYFSGGQSYGGGERPSPEKMKEIGADINEKLSTLLATHDLTVEDYRQRSPEIFADEVAVQEYLSANPDLKKRYEALPFDRMGRGGSGRGY
ncbi:hypothetical protein [Candidatus Nitrospira salsa]|nr:MAG: hypothetical protein NPIRA01_12590 [Nitrospirales bacterium]